MADDLVTIRISGPLETDSSGEYAPAVPTNGVRREDLPIPLGFQIDNSAPQFHWRVLVIILSVVAAAGLAWTISACFIGNRYLKAKKIHLQLGMDPPSFPWRLRAKRPRPPPLSLTTSPRTPPPTREREYTQPTPRHDTTQVAISSSGPPQDETGPSSSITGPQTPAPVTEGDQWRVRQSVPPPPPSPSNYPPIVHTENPDQNPVWVPYYDRDMPRSSYQPPPAHSFPRDVGHQVSGYSLTESYAPEPTTMRSVSSSREVGSQTFGYTPTSEDYGPEISPIQSSSGVGHTVSGHSLLSESYTPYSTTTSPSSTTNMTSMPSLHPTPTPAPTAITAATDSASPESTPRATLPATASDVRRETKQASDQVPSPGYEAAYQKLNRLPATSSETIKSLPRDPSPPAGPISTEIQEIHQPADTVLTIPAPDHIQESAQPADEGAFIHTCPQNQEDEEPEVYQDLKHNCYQEGADRLAASACSKCGAETWQDGTADEWESARSEIDGDDTDTDTVREQRVDRETNRPFSWEIKGIKSMKGKR